MINKLYVLSAKNRQVFSWLTSFKDIIENDYILSANIYNPYSGEEEMNYREPKGILKEIEKTEKSLQETFKRITKIL